MWALAGGAGLNIVLDLLFIFKFGWGMAGAALATGLAAVCSFVILASRFLAAYSGLSLTAGPLCGRLVLSIMANGFPSFLVETGTGLTILFLIGR